jgi:prefoldin subunit 5
MQINKKLFTTALTALLLLSMLSVAAPALAITAPMLSDASGQVGKVITVEGAPGSAAAGGPVKIYWDLLASTPLNTTTALGDGSYSVMVKIPDAKQGQHFIIAEDASGSAGTAFVVDRKITLSGSSGIPGDSVTVTGSGFAATSNITLTFYNTTGTVFTADVTPAVTNTSATGNFSLSFTVPAVDYGAYLVSGEDAVATAPVVAFTVGASITLSTKSGPTGTVVDVTGRGFVHAVQNIIITMNQSTTFTLAVNTTTIKTTSSGTFSGTFIVPSIGNGAATVAATEGTNVATATFTVKGITAITASPTSAAPSSPITITGSNFTAIAGKAVTISFSTFTYTFATNSSGGFSATLTTPGLPPGSYEIKAIDANGLNATIASYQLAITLLSVTPSTGPTGSVVSVTGYGFTAGNTFNVTMGTYLMTTGTVGASTATTNFAIPTMPAGTYTVTLTEDVTGLTASTTFTVNATSTLAVNPTTAPANVPGVTLTLTNFGASTAVSFSIQNSTYSTALSVSPSTTNSSGIVVGTFTVPAFTLGVYTIVANESSGMWNATTTFTIGDATLNVNTRLSTYVQGDLISFNIQSTFQDDFRIWIIDPQGTPTALNYDATWFVQAGNLYVMPYALSDFGAYTGDAFGLLLPSDAVTGTWTWNATLLSIGTTRSGTFTVVASAAASNVTNSDLSNKLDALNQTLQGIGTDVTSIKATIVTIQGDVATIKTSVGTQLTVSISSIQGTLTSIQNSIAGITSPNLGPITTSLNTINAKIDSLSGDTADISSSLGSITTSLASINTVVTRIDGNVATIQTDLGTLSGTVTSISGNIATIQTDIGTIKADISGLQTNVSAVQSDVTSSKTATDSLSPLIIVAIVLALIAAIAAIASIVLMRRKIAG